MRVLVTFICCLTLLFGVFEVSAKKLTYKEFGHLPMVQYPVVSPDGKNIAAVVNSDDGPSIVVSAFGSQDLVTIAKLSKSKDRFDSISWANNERLLISASYSKRVFNDYVRVNRLYAVNIDGSNLIQLQDKRTRKRPAWMDLLSSSRVVSLLNNDKEHILLQLYDEKDRGQSVYKVNVYDSSFDKLFINKYEVSNWFANTEDKVVFGIQYDGTDRRKDTINIWYRKDESEEWSMLHSSKMFADTSFTPVHVAGDKAYIISDRELGRDALWLYDIPSGKFDKLVFAHDKYDVSSVIFSADRKQVIGAVYFDHYRRNHYFDAEDASVYQTVEKSFAQYETTIAGMSLDRKQVLVLAQKDNSPPKYFWLDFNKRKAGMWFSTYPYLEGQALAQVRTFEFEASDGMLLNGYLTLPNNGDEKPPLIVHPHGGPQSRDYQYFNPYVQFMANKGYAVLQVNFRGSTGFGSDYENKGYREWGRKMQQDVYDAISWLAQNNVVDMDNVCMVGASYGGYVALTAAFEKPDMFKCIVSIAGVSDVKDIAELEHKKPTLRAFVEKTIGNPSDSDEAEHLARISPINHVNNIKAPVLLIHGGYDTQVPIKQSRAFYKAADDAGVDIETVEFKHGTHYLDENDNRQAAFKELGEFLQTHLD